MKGKISISRFSSNQPPYSGISIELNDELSGVHILDVTLTPEQFGNAVSGLGYTECEFELRGTEYVGLKRENKTEMVRLAEGEHGTNDPNRQRELLEPFEVDGWMGKEKDLDNHHNYDRKTHSIRVTFVRYVKPE